MIIQVILTLAYSISVESVAPIHSISQPTPITKKKKNKLLFTDERNYVKLNHFSTPFQVEFRSLPQDVGRNTCSLVLTYSEGSRFVTKFLSLPKLVIYKIYFRHQSGIPFRIYKNVANANLLLDWDKTDRDRRKASEQIL